VEGVSNAMTKVLEQRKAFDNARAQAREMVDRERALLGLSMIEARESGGESQATIAQQMGVGLQQVRAYEAAYRQWAEKHPDETLT
jgi:hypothetical protein